MAASFPHAFPQLFIGICTELRCRILRPASQIKRTGELRAAGIRAQTIARAVKDGELERISRGLYRHRDAQIEEHQILAEAATRVPKGVIALTSALALHALTDRMPRRVWIAIGTSDWSPVKS